MHALLKTPSTKPRSLHEVGTQEDHNAFRELSDLMCSQVWQAYIPKIDSDIPTSLGLSALLQSQLLRTRRDHTCGCRAGRYGLRFYRSGLGWADYALIHVRPRSTTRRGPAGPAFIADKLQHVSEHLRSQYGAGSKFSSVLPNYIRNDVDRIAQSSA